LVLPSAVRILITKVVSTRSIPFDLTATPRAVEVEVDAGTQAKMDESR
jgi:antitoxin component of RelBE/YafQ-DinJ toxin-antitoxin module